MGGTVGDWVYELFCFNAVLPGCLLWYLVVCLISVM